MRKKSFCLLFLALALLLPACEKKEPEGPEEPVLWFRTALSEHHGPALSAQPYDGSLEPEKLLSALLAGPAQEGLLTPFPKGVSLVRCQWDREQPGVLLVGLSEQYGDLADISLTLADYCIVLTLSQLEEVEQVEITAQGHWAIYRSHQQLSAEEAVLWDELAEVGAQ